MTEQRCTCETLPADFSVGIDHARACPLHAYRERGGVSTAAGGKPCLDCGRPRREHAR